MLSSQNRTPDLFDYIRSAEGTAEYVAFEPDTSLGLDKAAQFAQHKISTVDDPELFNHWAAKLLATGFLPFQVAVLRNPIAQSTHMQVLLAHPTPNHEILLLIARHPNASEGILSKMLDISSRPGAGKVDPFVAARGDLSERLIRRLISRGVPGVFTTLSQNLSVPETLRIEAGLLK